MTGGPPPGWLIVVWSSAMTGAVFWQPRWAQRLCNRLLGWVIDHITEPALRAFSQVWSCSLGTSTGLDRGHGPTFQRESVAAPAMLSIRSREDSSSMTTIKQFIRRLFRRKAPLYYPAKPMPKAMQTLFDRAMEHYDPRFPSSNQIVFLHYSETSDGFLPGYYQVNLHMHWAGLMGHAGPGTLNTDQAASK